MSRRRSVIAARTTLDNDESGAHTMDSGVR